MSLKSITSNKSSRGGTDGEEPRFLPYPPVGRHRFENDVYSVVAAEAPFLTAQLGICDAGNLLGRFPNRAIDAPPRAAGETTGETVFGPDFGAGNQGSGP